MVSGFFWYTGLIGQVTSSSQRNTTTKAVVRETMQIIEQPQDVTVCEGGRAQFSVKVAGTGNPKFQWQSSVDGINWNDIEGANVSIYDGLKYVTKVYDGLLMRVQIHLQNGLDITSNKAILRVEGKLSCTKQPQSQLVVEGGTLELNAEFSSKGKTYYQWQYSPYGTGTWINLPGEINSELSIQQISIDQSGGSFRVIGKSEGGCDSTISETAFMEVVAKPGVALNQGQDSYCGGGSTTFTVKMRGGSGKELIQWQESVDQGRTYRNLQSATDISYTIKRITEDMAGRKYRAHITLPGGLDVFTSEITITVFGAVAFNEQPRSQVICPGDAIVLEAKTDFRGSDPVYNWQMSTDSLHFTDIPSSHGNKLELESSATDRNVKYYRAVVNAGACQSMISDVARIDFLSVEGLEPIVKDVHVSQGDSTVTLVGIFEGDPKIFTITWQWSANDGATWQTINSIVPNKLILKHINQEVEGKQLYRLKVLNKVCARLHYSEPARVLFQASR